MRPIQVTTVLPHPPERVFAFVADSRNDPRWCPMVPTVTQTEGDGPGPAAAYAFRQKTAGGRTVDGTIRTLVFDPPARIVWSVEDAVRSYRITMTFAPETDGTRVTQTSEPRLKGLLRLVPAPLFRRQSIKVLEAQLRRLGRCLDAT